MCVNNNWMRSAEDPRKWYRKINGFRRACFFLRELTSTRSLRKFRVYGNKQVSKIVRSLLAQSKKMRVKSVVIRLTRSFSSSSCLQHFLMSHALVRIGILREQIAFQILRQSQAEHFQEKPTPSLGI